MPKLSVWAIRASLLYLALGFTLGGLMLANKGVPLHSLLWSLLPAHIDILLFGWTVQLAIGVAFWILPRFSHPPIRGNEKLAWLSFWCLNLGVWLVGLAAYLGGAANWALLSGRLCEVASVVAFALHAWPRVKPLGA